MGTSSNPTQKVEPYRPKVQIKIVTATALFDGHDAAINIMRRLLTASGCEVIHLGHNHSAEAIVKAAIEEDAHAIAVSSYQGGHMEFFKYMYDLLGKRGAGHIRIYGGGGGTIIPREIDELHEYGIARIFSPEDGRRMGLQGMINFMLQEIDSNIWEIDPKTVDEILANLSPDNPGCIARAITLLEHADDCPEAATEIRAAINKLSE